MKPAATVLAAAMSERDLHKAVTDMASAYGLLWWHATDPRKSNAGLPDLILLGWRGLAFVELKAEKGRLRPEQVIWLERLAAAGVPVEVIRPSDLQAGRVQALMEEIR